MKRAGFLIILALLVGQPCWAVKGENDYQMGLVFYEAGEYEPDYAEALKYFQRAVKSGHPKARMMLGIMYLEGQGVPTNYAEALELFSQSAEAGDPEAQFWLGTLYRTGRGTERDSLKAVALFEEAALQGFAPAQAALAAIYEAGQEAPLNYGRAHMWLNVLAAGGSQSAAEKREDLERYLSRVQIEQAQQQALEILAR